MSELNRHVILKGHHNAIEGADFWKSHIDQYQKTSLSRKAYCREAQISYPRFQYWFHKSEATPAARVSKAIPIRLKKEATPKSQTLLCSLDCSGGKRLFIHDLSVVKQLLSGDM